MIKLPLSNMYVPKRLSLLEILWSMRLVKKSSVNVCVKEAAKIAVSPFVNSGPFGSGYNLRNGKILECTGTVLGVQFGVTPVGIEWGVPPRAARDGTFTTLGTPCVRLMPS